MSVRLAEAEHTREDENYRWEELANAIIIQAVQDWRGAMEILRNHPYNAEAKDTVRETEEFFLSEFYALLTTYDGETLLNRLKEEYAPCKKHRRHRS